MRLSLYFVALAALLAGGCSAPEASADKTDAGNRNPAGGSVPISAAASPSSLQNCTPAMAEIVWKEASRQPVIAGAIQMVLSENGKRSYQVVKESTSRKFALEGGPSGPEWNDWISQKAIEEGLFSTSENDPDLDRTKEPLSKMKTAGTYVGYVGATEVTAPFSITCDGVKLSSGRLVAWEGALLGFLQCDRTPAANSPSVQVKKYC